MLPNPASDSLRRNQTLDTAMAVVADRGLDATRMHEVIRLLGTGHKAPSGAANDTRVGEFITQALSAT